MAKRGRAVKRERAETAWPTRRAAAAELSVIMREPNMSEETLKAWLEQPGCPLPRGRGPIPKIPLLIWIIHSKRSAGRPVDPGSAAVRDAQAAVWKAKAQRITGETVSVEDAQATIEAAADRLQHTLLEEIPDAMAELATTVQPQEMRDEARDRIAQAVNRWVQESRLRRQAVETVKP